jgi:hypothetical protein
MEYLAFATYRHCPGIIAVVGVPVGGEDRLGGQVEVYLEVVVDERLDQGVVAGAVAVGQPTPTRHFSAVLRKPRGCRFRNVSAVVFYLKLHGLSAHSLGTGWLLPCLQSA